MGCDQFSLSSGPEQGSPRGGHLVGTAQCPLGHTEEVHLTQGQVQLLRPHTCPHPFILGSYFQNNSRIHPTTGKGGLERQERSTSVFKLGQFKRAWEPRCGSAVGSPLGSSYLPCCDKMPDGSQGKRERFFFLAHSLRVRRH